MTEREARQLAPDDRVMFEGRQDDLGTVRRVEADGVVFDWDNGLRTFVRFELMNHEMSLWPAISRAPGSRVTQDDIGDERQAAERDDRFQVA